MSKNGAVVVTGVSSGIGEAIARELIAQGHPVFGSVRSDRDADAAAARMGAGFTPLVFDVTDEAAVLRGRDAVAARLGDGRLAGLVNNAGIAVGGPLLHQDAATFARHFEINVTGAFRVTQAFCPLLGTDPERGGDPGRIVMMSSISGRLATPFLGAYAASKHALEGYADTLRRELMPFGIDVVILGPGAVNTPIWDKAEEDAKAVSFPEPYAAPYRGFTRYMVENGRKGLAPQVIARAVADALGAKNPRARRALLANMVMGWTIPTLLPRRRLDRILARQMGLVAKR